MAASAAEIRAYAREAMRGKWGYGIIVWLLAMLLDTIFSLPVYLANDEGLFDNIWNIVSTGFSWCMWFGIMACFLDIVRKSQDDVRSPHATTHSWLFFHWLVPPLHRHARHRLFMGYPLLQRG